MNQKDMKEMFGSMPDRFTDRVTLALKSIEGRPTLRRITMPAALFAAVILITCMAASYALFSSQVADYFGSLYGREMEERLTNGSIIKVNREYTYNDATFIFEEVVFAEGAYYAVGTIRAAENSAVVLVPRDMTPDNPYGYDTYGFGGKPETAPEGSKTFAEVASETGCRLLMVEAIAGEGYTAYARRDGSIGYSAEVTDFVLLEEGKPYRIPVYVQVWEYSQDGEPLWDSGQGEYWDVQVMLPTAITAGEKN